MKAKRELAADVNFAPKKSRGPMISKEQLEAAKGRVGSALSATPCVFAPYLSELCSANVYLKLESLQRTGSFKERGAISRLLLLSPEEKQRGVVAASAGNHAQAVAYHASQLGIKSTIFMPKTTPLFKITRTQSFGATCVLTGENYDEAYEAADAFAKESGAVYVHAYNDSEVIAGQSSVAAEILSQMPQPDFILVPVGGGGLISGVASYVANFAPATRVVGIEPRVLPSMQEAILHKGPFQLKAAPTLADGIRVRKVGSITYDICKDLVKDWLCVSDDQIAHAILHLLEQEKVIAEGAGAASVAALMSQNDLPLKGKNVCAIISGGNIDVTLLSRVIERGLVENGRLVRLVVNLEDKPGNLAQLLAAVSSMEINVLEVHHERAFAQTSWNDVEVDLVVESRGHDHVRELIYLLNSKGYRIHAAKA